MLGSITSTAVYTTLAEPVQVSGGNDQHDRLWRRRRPMGKKEREDEPTKDFKKSVKDVDKPSKKEKKRLDKIVKRLPKNEKI
jgi:hypothetical protein